MKLQMTNDEWQTQRLNGARGGNSSFVIRHSPGAFTLIELILAIGIAAMVLIAVNTVFFAALHLRNDTADMVDAASPVDSVVTFMKRDLQCAVTPTNGTSKVLSGGFRAGENLTSTGVS